jgi:hypothetical protein
MAPLAHASDGPHAARGGITVKRLVCIAALALGFSALGQPAPQVKSGPRPATPQGEVGVNWAGPVLKATGSGAPDMRASSPAQARLGAEKAAKMDAFRNLLEQAKGIQVSAGKTVGDVMQRDEIRGRVEGVVKGYKVVGKRYYSDQGVELDVEVPLGALADALAPAAPADAPAASDTALASGKAGEKAGEKAAEKAGHSGLVVDATGLKVAPALTPRLVDEKGAAVYSADDVGTEARKAQGVASYHASLEEAKKSQRVGERPLVVKALRADGSDLVLPAEALAQLKASNPRYLAEGRVAIVSN